MSLSSLHDQCSASRHSIPPSTQMVPSSCITRCPHFLRSDCEALLEYCILCNKLVYSFSYYLCQLSTLGSNQYLVSSRQLSRLCLLAALLFWYLDSGLCRWPMSYCEDYFDNMNWAPASNDLNGSPLISGEVSDQGGVNPSNDGLSLPLCN